MEVLFVPIIIALIVSSILSLLFKASPKIDEGFEFNYYKLSYRRKFKRHLTMLPVTVVIIILVYLMTDWSPFVNIMFAVILLLFYIGQLTYTYYMWKSKEA